MSVTGGAHIEYFTDLVLNDGIKGVEDFTRITCEIINTNIIDSKYISSVTTKIDGSPALFFGVDPKDDKFFVSTKAFLNKTPVMGKSPRSIKKIWEGNSNLINIMTNAYIKLIKIKDCMKSNMVYKGDVLFSGKEIYKFLRNDGALFKPNSIIYVVNEDFPFYEQIRNFDFGICVHSMYLNDKGEIKVHPTNKYSFDTMKSYAHHRSIYVDDAFIDDEKFANLKYDKTEIFTHLSVITDLVDHLSKNFVDLQTLITKSGVEQLKTFLRKKLQNPGRGLELYTYARDNDSFTSSQLNDMVINFIKTLNKKQQKNIKDNPSIKTDIVVCLLIYIQMIKTQELLLNPFNKHLTKYDEQFINNNDTIEPTNGEGYVINFQDEGQMKILKFVDRIEFTKLNALSH